MRNLLAVLTLVFISGTMPGAPGKHHIILLDISGSMNWVLGEDKLPQVAKPPGQLSRIQHVQKALKNTIANGYRDGDTLHLYKFHEGLQPDQGKKKLTVVLNGAQDRAKATEWVENLTKNGKVEAGKFTYLYSSLSKVFDEAKDLLQADQAPSLLIISDGADTQKQHQGNNFKGINNFEEVCEKHKAVIHKLGIKVFCKIVQFDLGPDQVALEQCNFKVIDTPEVDKIFNIDASFAIKPPVPFVGAKIDFINETKSDPPKQFAQFTPDKLKYEWNFGDNAKSNDVNPTHTYKAAGNFTVILKATNPINPDDFDEYKKTVQIKPPLKFNVVTEFTMQTNGKTIPKGNEVWTIKNDILVAFENNTMAKFIGGIANGKRIPDALINYDWGFGGGKLANVKTPKPQPFPVGNHTITLKISSKDPRFKQLQGMTKQNLTVRQFKLPVIGVAGGKPVIDAGAQVALQIKPPFPQGTTFNIRSGDGQEKNGTWANKEIAFTYQKASVMKNNKPEPYQVKVEAILPGGEVVEVLGPRIIVQKQKGELFISNKNPWIGEEIKLQSLTPIPAGVKEKTTFTWNLGKGLDPVTGEKIDYTYLEAGKQMLELTIKRPDLADPIVVSGMLNVRGVEPRIVVNPKSLDAFIGESIPFKVVNNAPDAGEAFPPKTEIKWDFGDEKAGVNGEESVSYKTEGDKEVKVSVQVPGVTAPFVALLPKFTVKPVTVKIGVQ